MRPLTKVPNADINEPGDRGYRSEIGWRRDVTSVHEKWWIPFVNFSSSTPLPPPWPTPNSTTRASRQGLLGRRGKNLRLSWKITSGLVKNWHRAGLFHRTVKEPTEERRGSGGDSIGYLLPTLFFILRSLSSALSLDINKGKAISINLQTQKCLILFVCIEQSSGLDVGKHF